MWRHGGQVKHPHLLQGGRPDSLCYLQLRSHHSGGANTLLVVLIPFLQWTSSPFLGVGKWAVPVINVLLAVYTFTTGLHIDQVRNCWLLCLMRGGGVFIIGNFCIKNIFCNPSHRNTNFLFWRNIWILCLNKNNPRLSRSSDTSTVPALVPPWCITWVVTSSTRWCIATGCECRYACD